ncbi:NAD(P)H-hydrate dehydratase [Anaplasma bovis]|uniref:NAD(P)H-hydrate dehydratase n=1 Tax=Anaplasma bovis TaxID=186733 RepID=UPI002FF10FEF
MEILSSEQLRSCEGSSSFPVEALIRKAAGAVADELDSRFICKSVLVLCGPGNNGADGIVAARLLREKGWKVRVLGYRRVGDGIDGELLRELVIEEDVVLDAIFGIGLSRELDEDLRFVIEKVSLSRKFVISIDMPSGVNSDTGMIMGAAFKADLTIALSCLKFGHVLSPGRYYSGSVCLKKDLGIDTSHVSSGFLNSPNIWMKDIPRPDYKSHKYNRGYSVICSLGAGSVGAVKLSAMSSLRVGSGAVAVACEVGEIPLYAAALTSVMYKTYEDVKGDARVTAILIGPGGDARDSFLKHKVIEVLAWNKACVLDAGALSVFEGDRESLSSSIVGKKVVITPHEGEFRRIFPDISDSHPVHRARKASEVLGCVVVLKGHDTIIASPDGRVIVNNNAPCSLATAGSGDVLAGIITGLIACGMPEFYAACCGVWVHGECGKKYALGLIADDIVQEIPKVLASIGMFRIY